VVERQFEQCLRYGRVALEQRHLVFRENLADELRHGGGKMRRQLRRFQNGRIARRDGGNQRPEGEVYGIVPGRNDQAAAARLVLYLAGVAGHQQGRTDPGRLHPRLQVPDGIVRFNDDRQDFRDIDFACRLPEIRAGRLVPGIRVGDEPVAQPDESGDALRCGRAAQAQRSSPLALEHIENP